MELEGHWGSRAHELWTFVDYNLSVATMTPPGVYPSVLDWIRDKVISVR